MHKNNLLVLGVGPLPIDGDGKLFAPGLRTWHFAQMLHKHDHTVTVGVTDFGSGAADDTDVLLRAEDTQERLTIFHFRYSPQGIIEFLRQRHKVQPFDGIVATTDIMNSIAAQVALGIPLWSDYNGDVFAEKQLMGKVHGNDATLKAQWTLFLDGLLAGDRFSTCSPNQTYALIGQLGFAGRLNQFTAGEDLVHTLIPCSHAMLKYSENETDAPRLRGELVPEDAYIILWLGGYNSWTAPSVLFEGLSIAMRRNSHLYFVSTGGALDGHITATFEEFYHMIQASDLRDRFKFTGWLPTRAVPAVARQADIAVNLDAKSVEAELGFRNRIIDWILYGLPVISTTESHLTQTMAAQNLLYPVITNAPASLAEAILRAENDRTGGREMATRAAEWLAETLDEEKVFAPFVRWAETPIFAGDRQNGFCSSLSGALKNAEVVPSSAQKVSFLRRIARWLKRCVRQMFSN